jgi:hypothetical protein
MASSNFVSFKDLKQRKSIEHVLRYYNLFEGLYLRSKIHCGPCPFCGVEERVLAWISFC